jgi:hypothetical protein
VHTKLTYLQEAVKKFNEQKKRRFQESLHDLNIGADLFSATTIMPALFGEIEVNNSILELLTQNLDKNLQKRLIRSLSDDENIDLTQFFPNLALSKTNRAFIKSIYPRTKSCISQATNIMNYHLNALVEENKQTEHEEKLFKMIEKFELLVGPENSNWRSLISESHEPDAVNIKTLLKYVRITTTQVKILPKTNENIAIYESCYMFTFSFDCQSIIYLFRNVSSSSIEEKLRIMRYCHDLSERRKDISFNDEDKFCYTKLALTKLLVFMSRRSDFIPEAMFLCLEQLVVTYSKYLCEVGFDHSPEPYLFFLMLNWY